MEEQGLLPGLLRPSAQLLQRVPGQCVLLASQWDVLRMEEQGLLPHVCRIICCRFGCSGCIPGASEHRQRDGLARRESVRLRGGGHASSCSGRVGLLQRVLRQLFLLASQWNLLRMEKQGLLP